MPALAAAVPRWVEAVTICAHADAVGQINARRLAAALDVRGIEVRIEDKQQQSYKSAMTGHAGP
jgi:hypothetical protein